MDCVSAQESAFQIITGNYDIRLNTGKQKGNADLSGQKWQKEGIVGEVSEFKLSNFSKRRGEIVTQSDYDLGEIAANIRNEAGNTVGTTFFTFEAGKDFHGGIAGVTLEYNVSGTLNATYFISDQSAGYRSWDTEEGFNAFFENHIFKNTTTENQDGQRYYNPGSTGGNIGQGNEKIVFRKVKKGT